MCVHGAVISVESSLSGGQFDSERHPSVSDGMWLRENLKVPLSGEYLFDELVELDKFMALPCVSLCLTMMPRNFARPISGGGVPLRPTSIASLLCCM